MTAEYVIEILNEYFILNNETLRYDNNDLNNKKTLHHINSFKRLFQKYGYDREDYLKLISIIDSDSYSKIDRDQKLNDMLINKRDKKINEILK